MTDATSKEILDMVKTRLKEHDKKLYLYPDDFTRYVYYNHSLGQIIIQYQYSGNWTELRTLDNAWADYVIDSILMDDINRGYE